MAFGDQVDLAGRRSQAPRMDGPAIGIQRGACGGFGCDTALLSLTAATDANVVRLRDLKSFR